MNINKMKPHILITF